MMRSEFYKGMTRQVTHLPALTDRRHISSEHMLPYEHLDKLFSTCVADAGFTVTCERLLNLRLHSWRMRPHAPPPAWLRHGLRLADGRRRQRRRRDGQRRRRQQRPQQLGGCHRWRDCGKRRWRCSGGFPGSSPARTACWAVSTEWRRYMHHDRLSQCQHCCQEHQSSCVGRLLVHLNILGVLRCLRSWAWDRSMSAGRI